LGWSACLNDDRLRRLQAVKPARCAFGDDHRAEQGMLAFDRVENPYDREGLIPNPDCRQIVETGHAELLCGVRAEYRYTILSLVMSPVWKPAGSKSCPDCGEQIR
jgi:hypothetical protein